MYGPILPNLYVTGHADASLVGKRKNDRNPHIINGKYRCINLSIANGVPDFFYSWWLELASSKWGRNRLIR
jgi:hypothetical protein